MTLFGTFGKHGDLRDTEFPRAGELVDGLAVRDEIPNRSSIAATLTDYRILPGVRIIDMASIPGEALSHAGAPQRIRDLADAIATSGEINPLIVVVSAESIEILEGAHRIDALDLLGKTRFPALVVLDST